MTWWYYLNNLPGDITWCIIPEELTWWRYLCTRWSAHSSAGWHHMRMHWWSVTHQLVLDRCVTHTIYGLGTELKSGGLLYRDTTMAGYRMCRRHGCNQKVNVKRFILRVMMWSSYKLLANTRMWPRTSAQMDFWSRFCGPDQVYLVVLPGSITWVMLPGIITWVIIPDTYYLITLPEECYLSSLPDVLTWTVFLTFVPDRCYWVCLCV